MRHKTLFIFSLLFALNQLSAQKLSLGYIYPAGGERGTTLEVEIGGMNLSTATAIIISGEGVKAEIVKADATVEPNKKKKRKSILDDQSSPQLADRLTIKISIAKNATPGLRDLRMESLAGVSNKLNFEVGQYPNQLEFSANSIQLLNPVTSLPATLCGQILPGEVDAFSFKATKGMKLVAAVKARTLIPYIADAVPGWFQAVIQIKNSKGEEIAFNDDFKNDVDPVIITNIQKDDTYTLSIHDAIYRGREDFNYRIDLGEIPYLSSVYPCVGKIDKKINLKLNGVNLKTNSITFKPTKEGYGEINSRSNNDYISNTIPFYGLKKSSEYNSSASKAFELTPDTELFDSITKPYQIKSYTLSAEKGENIALEIKARKLGSLLDAKMRLIDPSGKTVLEADDVEDATQGLMTFHADPTLQYKVTEAGIYRIEVEDVLGNCGIDYFYLLERKKSLPTYEVFVSPANLTIPKGGTALLRLDITTNEQFVPELEIEIKGLPNDFLVSSLQSPAGNKTWEITITAPQNAKEQQFPIEVLTKAQVKGNQLPSEMQAAGAADNMMQAFYYTHHIPAAGFVASITKASPFSIHLSKEIEAKLSKPILVSATDSLLPIQIFIERKNGFDEPIELNLGKKTNQISMDPVTVQVGESEKTVFIKLEPKLINKLKRMRMGFNIVGTVKGVVDKRGQRSFQNAKYREQTPIFILEKKLRNK
jgi:hypothetical protein